MANIFMVIIIYTNFPDGTYLIFLGVLNAWVGKTSHPLWKILVYICSGVYVISYALVSQGMAN